jgi:rSAM/selenodomain-associated transferase 2
MTLSIIIPTLNEAETLGQTLLSLKSDPAEIIVVDGGSIDSTVQVAHEHTPHVLVSRPGRGVQQDTGARQSQGDVLVFLHADTRLPKRYQSLIDHALADPGVVFGAFLLRIYPSSPALDVIAFMANLRSRLLSLPYGDQALFVRRSAYFLAGGFKDWPIMEDVDLVRRLNQIGGFRLARGAARTSPRRWQKENPVCTTLRNYSLILRYLVGVSPHTLARHYPDIR